MSIHEARMVNHGVEAQTVKPKLWPLAVSFMIGFGVAAFIYYSVVRAELNRLANAQYALADSMGQLKDDWKKAERAAESQRDVIKRDLFMLTDKVDHLPLRIKLEP